MLTHHPSHTYLTSDGTRLEVHRAPSYEPPVRQALAALFAAEERRLRNTGSLEMPCITVACNGLAVSLHSVRAVEEFCILLLGIHDDAVILDAVHRSRGSALLVLDAPVA